MMETETIFKRDMNHNYLILPVKSESYQVTMFCKNTIGGLLSGDIKIYNGEEMIYYDISSRQNLSRVFERKEMGFEEVKTLFYSWSEAVSESERFLLDPMHFQCSPEFIYYSYSDGREAWLFYPENKEREEPDGLVSLAEFLLEKVDHKDLNAVDLVYQFYRSVKDGSFLLSQILNRIETLKLMPVMKEETGTGNKTVYEELLEPGESDELSNEEQREGILGKIGRFFQGLGKKKNEFAGSETTSGDFPAAEYDESAYDTLSCENEEEEEEYTKTRLLWSEENERRELTSITGGEIYPLNRLPFVVGKSEADVDLCLKDPSVSMLHARFFERDGKVWLEDLNSTNGCVVNDLRIETNETVMLARGDRIYFGDSGFIYN